MTFQQGVDTFLIKPWACLHCFRSWKNHSFRHLKRVQSLFSSVKSTSCVLWLTGRELKHLLAQTHAMTLALHMCVHARTRTHTHTHTHSHTHTHTHTHTLFMLCSWLTRAPPTQCASARHNACHKIRGLREQEEREGVKKSTERWVVVKLTGKKPPAFSC